MSSSSQIILFGDLTCDFNVGLQSLLLLKDNALLTSFFERTAFALRAEIGRLSSHQRENDGLVKFNTIAELLARMKLSSSSHPALEKALTTVHQFACVIAYYSEVGRTYPTAVDTRIIGLCTGLLTGVAVSCCRSLSELIPLAVHTTLVAFRTGLCVSEVRNRIDPTSSSWSVMIPGLASKVADEVLLGFSAEKGLSAVSRPYISAYSKTGITISGPPSVLEELLRSHYLPKSSSLSIPIRAPYHAAHLYDSSSLDGILKPSAESEFAQWEGKIPVMFGVNNNETNGATYISLLRSALNEILLEPLRIDQISEGISSNIKSSGFEACTVKPVATSATQAIFSTLKRSSNLQVSIDSKMNNFKDDSNVKRTSDSGNFGSSKLAIVGYSGRFPDARSTDEFWELLREGRDVASVTPLQRWDVKTHVDPTLKKKNTSGTPYGCWLKDPGFFDAKFFYMSPREAPQVDPAQRLALMTAYEAMEFAGMVPDATPSTQRDRVGVFYGTTSNDWGETNSSQDVDTYYIPGSCRAFIPGRQNYFFKFSGPSYSVDTACSSSLAAMHLACNALWRGDIDTAIAGGTNVMTNPDITAGLDRGHFLSRTGNCKTFDDEADGYCRGEGVVTVIIKRLEDAIADNDPVLAVILDAYTNHSAEAESITRPHVGAQKAIFEKVLVSAAVDPNSVGYVEMHGTGTQAGDAREMESVLSTFGNPKQRQEPLYIGSAKANVGHGESVSGVIALTKVLMMMEKNEIPPHCGIKNKLNSKFPKDLQERGIRIASEPTAWNRKDGQARRALINNFSAAGGNSSVLVEDAPEITKLRTEDPRSTHMVAVSAKSSTALAANAKALLEFIDKKVPSLPSLSYTTTARRTHHAQRMMVSGSNLTDIAAQLTKRISSLVEKPNSKAKPSVAFAFTGNGSQYPGMARELLQFKTFRRDLESFDSMAQKQGFASFMPVITNAEGDISDHSALIVQLATTCTQMAMANLWKSWGIQPTAVVGHSLGEYAALNVAGVLSDADTIYLTGKRAELMQEFCTRDTHSMLAVGASVEELNSLLKGIDFEIACKNAPAETVLSGTNATIDRAFEVVAAKGLKKTKLRVPYAFHSSQVEPVLKEFIKAARSVTFHAPKTPVLSPLLKEVINSGGIFNAVYLARHCREAVDFAGVLKVAKGTVIKDKTTWIEIGPHPVVVGLLKSNLGSVPVLPTLQRNKDTWKVLCSTLTTLYEAGHEIKWNNYQHDFAASLDVLKLPSYKWDLKNYWMQYTNDWSLYKGDAGFLTGAKPAGISTTCVQKLVEDKTEDGKITVVGESDLLREDLDPFVRGHRVNGVALCTPSVYAEMALVIGDYIRRKDSKYANCLVDVTHMDVQKPLAVVSKGKGPQYARCQIVWDTKAEKGAVEFWSVTPEGKKLTKHAESTVLFLDNAECLAETQKSASLILDRMVKLRASLADDDRVQKLKGSSGYQLVSSLASYDDDYRGVSEVVLNSKTLEIVAQVRFDMDPVKALSRGTFNVDPYLIDNFGQPALFVMNANDTADLTKEVYVNHGWTSLQFYKEVSIHKTYRSYAKMDGPFEDGMYGGDMTVFEGDEVVACFRGVKAQMVPRRLMDYIVKMRDDTQTDLPRAANRGTATTQQCSYNGGAQSVSIQVTAATSVRPEVTDTWADALNIIAEESGVPVAELTPDKEFADLGIDSLLSLLCASRFREELGLVYPSSIFEEYHTVAELKSFWKKAAADGGVAGGINANDAVLASMFHDDIDYPSSSVESEDPKSSTDNGSDSGSITDQSDIPEMIIDEPKIKATSLLLQGNPNAVGTTRTLFLLPDGSGSAYSYGSLPLVNDSLAIVALNCPYMKEPERYGHGISTVAAAYVEEIRRRQPSGPYALCGWSVGGIFAYHCAQLLAGQGDVVSDLVLLDCPVPRGLDHLPRRYFEYCEKIGLLGAVHATTGARRAPPPWLIGHFEACVDSLHDYYATPFEPVALAPTTHIIWACDSIDAKEKVKFERRAEDPEGLKFLTEERKDYGPCGWETLLPESRMEFSRVDGAHHFSMMKGEKAGDLAKLIEKALM